MCALNFTVILCCIVDSEVRWQAKEELDDPLYVFYEDPEFYVLNIFRLLSLGCVISTMRLTFIWYEIAAKKLKQRNKLSQSSAYPLKLRAQFTFEILICAIHIPPFADVRLRTYNQRQFLDYLTIAAFLKIYVLIRLMREKSPLNSNSGRFIGSFTNIEFTDLFYIKTWLKDNPFQAMLIAVGVLLLCCSYTVYLAERRYPINCNEPSGKFANFLNALWLIIITVFTVGYGDIVPETDLGRFIAVLAALCGLILTATLIGLVHQYLTLNNDESNLLKFIAEHQRIKQYQECALDVIMQAIRIFVLKSQRQRS